MANRGRSFLFLLLMAAALGGYVWFVEMQRNPDAEAEAPREKLFTADAAQIRELRITNERGETSTLRREGERWSLAETPGAEVDETEVNGILTALTSLESNRVVDAQPASLAEYGLDKPRITASFTDGAGAQHTVLIGSKTPMAGDLYAKLADAPRVVLIGSYLEETFNRSRLDLREKSALKFAREAVGTITLTSEAGTTTLARSAGAWNVTSPFNAPADEGAVDALLSRLSSARVQTFVDASATADTGLAKPSASVAITAGPTQAVLEIGGPAGEGSVYARDSARNVVFTIESSLADELKKKPEEFRKKAQ